MPQAVAVDQQTCDEEGVMDADLEKETPKKKKQNKQSKKKKPPAKPAVPGVPLKEVPDQRPVARPLLKETPGPNAVYEPGVFQERKKTFVSRLRADGMKYADAVKQWMLSSERADYLSSLPESELKKRRFL